MKLLKMDITLVLPSNSWLLNSLPVCLKSPSLMLHLDQGSFRRNRLILKIKAVRKS